MKKLLFLMIIFTSGCYSINVNVQPVNQWEGHYYSVKEFQEKTENIQLQENESIWVLSNTTLKNVIKNVK